MKVILSLLCLAFLFSCSTTKPLPAGVGKKKSENIAYFKDWIKAYPQNTQLAIAIIEDGKPTYYGVKMGQDSAIVVRNEDSYFQIGSISKVFTATLLSSLVSEGKVKLDDPILPYFGMADEKNRSMTFKQLANHTSGLPRLPKTLNPFKLDLKDPYKDFSNEDLEKYFQNDLEIRSTPGTKYAYTNLGAGTLGYLVGKISGTTYEEALQKRICAPYGLKRMTSEEALLTEPKVVGLDPSGKVTPYWHFKALGGAGSMYASLVDMARFLSAQFDAKNTDLVRTQQTTFTTAGGMKLGLGWHIDEGEGGEKVHWHNGGVGGFTTCMAFRGTDKKGVVVLSNISAFHRKAGQVDKLCFSLLKKLK